MGFRFRKSIKIGPARINLSNSGIGYSIGAGGLRYTKSPKKKSKKQSTKRQSDKKTTKPANTAAKATPAVQQDAPAQVTPIKKSWILATVMAIISFVVVAFILFVVLFILYAIASIFVSDTTVWSVILIVVPVVLGAITAVIAFRIFMPEKVPTETAEAAEVDDPADIPVAEQPETLPEEPQKSAYQIESERRAREFEKELSEIPRVPIQTAPPAHKQLVRDMPEYSFSNITRKTRLDSIFPIVFLDVETTGFAPASTEIIEVSAIKFETGMVPVACFTTLCKPKKPIPEEATKVNHITDDMVADAPSFAQIAPALSEFIKDCHLAGHNLEFDLKFIHAHGAILPSGTRFYDTLDLAHLTIPSGRTWNYKLPTLCDYYRIHREGAHRALSDSYATAKLFTKLVLEKTSRNLEAAATTAPDSEGVE